MILIKKKHEKLRVYYNNKLGGVLKLGTVSFVWNGLLTNFYNSLASDYSIDIEWKCHVKVLLHEMPLKSKG